MRYPEYPLDAGRFDKFPARLFRPEERPSNVLRIRVTGTSSKGKLPGCYRDKEFTLTPDYVYFPSICVLDETPRESPGHSSYTTQLKNGKPVRVCRYHGSAGSPEAWTLSRGFASNWVTVEILEEEPARD